MSAKLDLRWSDDQGRYVAAAQLVSLGSVLIKEVSDSLPIKTQSNLPLLKVSHSPLLLHILLGERHKSTQPQRRMLVDAIKSVKVVCSPAFHEGGMSCSQTTAPAKHATPLAVQSGSAA